jgi:hypothetical protein
MEMMGNGGKRVTMNWISDRKKWCKRITFKGREERRRRRMTVDR